MSNIREARAELEELRREIRQTQREILVYRNTLSRSLSLARRMGLPDAVDKQVAELQRLIAILNSLIATYRALQMARLAAGDPIAWVQAGIEVTGTLVSIGMAVEASSH